MQAAPCDVWQAAAKAKAGDVVFLRGGTYPISKNLILANHGTRAAPVIYESYPGEAAVLDGSQHTKGAQIHFRLQGRFVQLRRLEVKSMPMRGILVTGTDNLLDGVHAHHNGLTGIQLWAPQEAPYATQASRNTLRNCTANDNSDAGLPADGGNADGIGISSGANNRVENCLVYANSDDGIDTWA